MNIQNAVFESFIECFPHIQAHRMVISRYLTNITIGLKSMSKNYISLLERINCRKNVFRTLYSFRNSENEMYFVAFPFVTFGRIQARKPRACTMKNTGRTLDDYYIYSLNINYELLQLKTFRLQNETDRPAFLSFSCMFEFYHQKLQF